VTLTVLGDSITSDRTAHSARVAAGDGHLWEVSWLPGRHMNRNSAITAMMIADVTGPGEMHVGHRLWPHVAGWAAELALAAGEALDQVAKPPSWASVGRGGEMEDPEGAE